MPPTSSYPLNLECPKCQKHTIVQESEKVYSCINCSFRRDLTESRSDSYILITLTTAGMVLLLFR